MEKTILNRFKALFERQKRDLVYSGKVMNEEFNLKPDDLADEVDLTSTENETGMRMRLRNREALFLKKIEEALARISKGTFGQCSSCEDEISMKRLEARPTATLCVDCKESQEQSERLHIDGHRYKSLGNKFQLG
ncbi:MAG: TraR/DksA C4-type zinc finger protein [Bdellovibrionales bacterium]|nr:TraR/DksA C4-type zinc finger protein [Bdellovibrionales bacterium]